MGFVIDFLLPLSSGERTIFNTYTNLQSLTAFYLGGRERREKSSSRGFLKIRETYSGLWMVGKTVLMRHRI